MLKAKFVEHNKGKFKAEDGREVEYNSVIVSDGLVGSKIPCVEDVIIDAKRGDSVELLFTLGKKGVMVSSVKVLK